MLRCAFGILRAAAEVRTTMAVTSVVFIVVAAAFAG
jgi:hypothetical protein